MNAVANAQNTAVSTASDNYYAAYGDATTQRTIVGDLLKFSKGEYLRGKDGDEVAEGTELVANMDELMVGWIRWEGGKPTDHVMGKVGEGYVPPKRNTLGDDDEARWEVDESSGQPRDPWQFSNYLIMKEPDSDQLFTFTTSSRGGINAVGDLCKRYGKEMRQRPNDFPIVSLDVDSYRHPNKAYGKIFVPVLRIAGWSAKTGFAEALADEAADREASSENATASEQTASRGKTAAKQSAPAGEETRF